MNNAMNEDLVVTNIAANDNFVCLNLATDATSMRFTCITSSDSKLPRISETEKTEFGILFLADMVRLLITASHVLYDFCE